jgi:hypothetical protein
MLPGSVHCLLDAVQIVHQLRDGADGSGFIDGDVGFLEVGMRPFQMFTGNDGEPVSVEARPHGGLGGSELPQQRLSLTFNSCEIGGVH